MHIKATPTLVMIRGIPGSGKSYLAAALRESLGQDEVVILDPDAIDQTNEEYVIFSKELSKEGVDAKFHPYRFSRAKAYQAIILGKVVVWNQAFINLDGFEKTVKNLQAFALEHDLQLPLLVVEVEVGEAIAKERIAKRRARGGHDVPDDAFSRFVGSYVSFSDKGYSVVKVRGENDVAVSVEAIKKALEQTQAT